MCGLVALAGDVPADLARAATEGAAARGPHSNGWATWRERQGWRTSYAPGRLDAWPTPSSLYPVAIGHSRLATSTARPGDAPDPDEGQPLLLGGLVLAHNGTLRPNELEGHRSREAYQGPVDSGRLLNYLALGRTPDELVGRLHAPQALLWARPHVGLYAMRLTGVRVPAHPLYAVDADTYAAVSSAPIPDGRLLDPDAPHLIWSF